MKRIQNFKDFVNEQYNEETNIENIDNEVEENSEVTGEEESSEEESSEEDTKITTESVDNKGKESVVKKPARYKSVKDEDFIFSDGGKVTGWHFPINTKVRGRNALQRANQYDNSPVWYSGSLKSLVTKVANTVKKKYPDIEVTEKSKKPGKG